MFVLVGLVATRNATRRIGWILYAGLIVVLAARISIGFAKRGADVRSCPYEPARRRKESSKRLAHTTCVWTPILDGLAGAR